MGVECNKCSGRGIMEIHCEQSGVSWDQSCDLCGGVGSLEMEWISVEDRLPETDERCLTIDRMEKYTAAIYDHDLTCWFRCDNGCIKAIGYTPITHWMPLPELPKETPND